MNADYDTPSLLLGLIGEGIGESLSPTLYETESTHHGLKCIYRRIDLDTLRLTPADLPALLQAAERFGFAGLNITHPCKQAVIPYLDTLSDEARAIGAVNTIVLREGRRIGHNTDHYGFYKNLTEHLPDCAMDHVVQLGAGGAGVAVADAALLAGVRALTIFDRAAGRAEDLARSLSTRFPQARVRAGTDLPGAMREADGLIHATPTGMRKHPGMPLPAELIDARQWVAEIVYFPLETELLRVARQKGCRTVDGLGMVVHQAAKAFELFTGGRLPDARRMGAHVADILARQAHNAALATPSGS
jgi:shikimate dehydrogenase